MPRKLDITKLNTLYNEAEQCDRDLFSEMRSNILLTSGNHYRTVGGQIWERIKSVPKSEPQKLRLVKNHVQRIVRHYTNGILNAAPGVRVFPHNDSELSDVKTAELNQSIWEDAKNVHDLPRKVKTWASNFVQIGEVATYIFWDPNKGKLLGFRAMKNDMGEDMKDENDELVPDKTKPVFSGELCFEKLLPFNLMRAKEAETMKESPFLIIRKMVDIKRAKKMFSDLDEDKIAMIEESGKTTFKVFDGYNGTFNESHNQAMFRNFYFRPSIEYPKGYFYITTEKGILAEGELPFGIFPIVWEGDEEIETTPRAHGVVRHLRPYQAEINRTASEISTHQIVHGSDRMYLLNGSKVSKGIHLPGLRVFNVSGQEPKLQPGRTGEQYFSYLSGQIQEMYEIADLAEIKVDQKDLGGQLDVYPLLFRSLKDKQKFSMKAEKFEAFLVNVCKTYLSLAKNYYSDDKVVRGIGRKEAVNIPEFRAADLNDVRIKVEPVSDDIASTVGRALQINTLLQFVGNELPDEERANLIKNMPFLNHSQIVSGLTIDYENITADILALDRGEFPEVSKEDNHKEYMRRLTHRMKQKDFRQLHPQIQQAYTEFRSQHQEMEAQQQQELLEAQAGFIPTGGGLAKADLYEPDPKSPEKQRRATFPVEALQWLKQRLDAQGLNQQQLESIQEQNLVEMNQFLQQTNQQPGGGLPAEQDPLAPPIPIQPQGGI